MRFDVLEALHARLQCQGLAISSIIPLPVEWNATVAISLASDYFESDCNAADATALPTNRARDAPGRLRYTGCALPTAAARGYFVPAKWDSSIRQPGGRNSAKI